MEMGGSEVALLAFLKALAADGHRVTLLLLEKAGPTLDRIPDGVTVEELRFRSDILAKLAGKRIPGVPFFYAKKAIAKILRIFLGQNKKRKNLYPFLLNRMPEREEHYDLLFDFYGYGDFMTAYGAEKVHANRKASWFHDEDIGLFWGDGKVNPWLDRYQKLFCVSSAVKNALDAYYPQYADRSEVLLNFIDTDEILRKANEAEPDEAFVGPFKILTVGRLRRQKGIDIAVGAAAIMKSRGLDFQWYVIGEGSLETEYATLIREKGVEDRFHLLGRRENPYPYFRACDLYVQPSRHEGYSIAVIEAKTLCRPIIASDIPSNREQITNLVNGILTKLDEGELAEKIIDLYDHPEKSARLSEALRAAPPAFLSEYAKLRHFMTVPL